MVEIPEHLLKRSQDARTKAESGGEAASEDVSTEAAETPAAAVATATATAAVVEAAPTSSAGGNGGKPAEPLHTHRLLTVVKSGSIQQAKAEPTDKVNVWPHLLVIEFLALLACTAFLVLFSIFVNAPLLAEANYNKTPNPSKAPWYFLGLQELLAYFDPMIAGVTIPGVGLVGLTLAPFIDKNPSNLPDNRKFAITLFTFFMMFWTTLVIIGSFFRGHGYNFAWPWSDGIFFDL